MEQTDQLKQSKKISLMKLTGRIITFLTNIITLRILTPDLHSIFILATSLIAWKGLSGLGIASSGRYYIGQEQVDKKHIIHTTLTYTLICSAITTIAILLLIPMLTHNQPEKNTITTILTILALTLPLETIQGTIAKILHGLNKPQESNQTIFIQDILSLTTIPLILLFKTPGLAIAQFIKYSISLIYSIKLLKKHMPAEQENSNKTSFTTLLKYGLPLVTWLVVRNYMDTAIPTLLIPPNMIKHASFLATSLSLGSLTLTISQGVNQTLFSRITNQKKGLDKKTKRWLIYGTIISGAIMATVGPIAIPLLYGNAFIEMIPCYLIIVIQQTIEGIAITRETQAQATNKLKTLIIATAIACISEIILCNLLIPIHASAGSATAYLISRGIIFFGILTILLKIQKNIPFQNTKYIKATKKSKI